MDVAGLTAFLAPYLPYMLKVGDRFATDAATRFGEQAWAHARQLWERLRSSVAEEPTMQVAVDEVAAAPEDERARAFLELQLERLLEADPALANELERLWSDAAAANVVASGDRSVAIGRDVSGTVVTGDDAVITGDDISTG